MLPRVRVQANHRLPRVLEHLRVYNHGAQNQIYDIQRPSGYTGGVNCGPISYLMAHELKKDFPRLRFRPGYSQWTAEIPTFHPLQKDGLFRAPEVGESVSIMSGNHLCIRSANVIIDPTYRQVLWSRWCPTKEGSPYGEYLYNKLPPVFVGTRRELRDVLQDLANLERRLSGKTSIIPDIWLQRWWSFNTLPPFAFDLDHLLSPEKFRFKSETLKRLPGMKSVIQHIHEEALIN
jgi:hypothetical protein